MVACRGDAYEGDALPSGWDTWPVLACAGGAEIAVMAAELRKTGISGVGDMPRETYWCHGEVRDNGSGIMEEERTESRSLGLLGIRERAQLIGGTIARAGPTGNLTHHVIQNKLGN